jgi:hypothetical protein
MRFPFQVDHRYRLGFTIEQARLWVEQNRPTQIEMTDVQYAWLSELTRGCPVQFQGAPIVFTDAPQSRV